VSNQSETRQSETRQANYAAHAALRPNEKEGPHPFDPALCRPETSFYKPVLPAAMTGRVLLPV
jgi:hypothetical protein